MAAVGSVDVEAVLIAWLTARLPGAVVRAELDNNLANELPTVQVERAAGDDDGFRLDRALVDVNVYGATRGDAVLLSATVRGLLLTDLRGTATGGAVFGRIATVSAPSWRPYENTSLRRLGAMYEIYSHPVS
ncbi:hypothetical protein ACFC0S_16750 [Streptomyces sp. NPDC056084]|uniref:hypothetical protein n=1 Tax=unclassified Streptomyces TaxID=2593676 RepID=UPI0035E2590B